MESLDVIDLTQEKDMFLHAMLSLLVTALLISTSLAAGYQDLLDSPATKGKLAANRLLNGVAMSGKRLVGVGQRGHIVYSDDQGKSWVQAGVPVSSDLVAVYFPTVANGWAVGHDGVVLHSSDGGATWAKQFDGRAAAQVMVDYYAKSMQKNASGAGQPQQDFQAEIKRYLDQGADKPFLDVWFENDNSGYIVGAFNLIFRTSDGGKSWVPLFDRIDNPKRFHLYAIRKVGPDLYIAGEQGSLFRLDAKTEQFKTIKTPYTGTFFGITGKKNALIVYGMRGTAFRSSNGGAGWSKIPIAAPVGLTGATVTGDGRIVLVNQAGLVLVSSDDGANFTPLKIEHPIPASGVAALDKDTLVLVGLSGAKLQSIK
jgi:photosystem II stability/assembly factor-like uncharacterized protein